MTDLIRVASARDRKAVETLVLDAYGPSVARIGRKPGPMLDDYAASIAAGHVRVAERDGAISGVLVLVPERDVMLLDNVAVTPSAQGTGLGAAPLSYAEHAALEAGYARIRLYTHELMTENIAGYTRLGYVETHRGEDAGFRRVHMTKMLTKAPIRSASPPENS